MIVQPLKMLPSKAEQIMARYRPIAPRPHFSHSSHGEETSPSLTDKNFIPYFMGLASCSSQLTLSKKSARGRKRRLSHVCCSSKAKKSKKVQMLEPPLDLALQLGFYHNSVEQADSWLLRNGHCGGRLFALSPFLQLSCIMPLQNLAQTVGAHEVASSPGHAVAEDKGLMQMLQAPLIPATKSTTANRVFAPQPVRPVGSSISVRNIVESGSKAAASVPVLKSPEEVEEEVESEALPAIVSDFNNRVRLSNSAYREMVGQPECAWLDSMMAGDASGLRPATARRINGEVLLLFGGCSVPTNSTPLNAFSCRVEIRWKDSSSGKKMSMAAPCEVIKLSCDSRDYLFTWRFHVADEGCE